jgi:hypothetical protein
MPKKSSTQNRLGLSLPILALGIVAVLSSFTLGIKTAADVKTVSPMEASGSRISGDVNNDGVVNTLDVIAILEVARGYKDATPDELLADPNSDGQLSIDDAIRILSDLQVR